MKRRPIILILLAPILVACLPATAAAQVAALQKRLAATKSVICTFPALATGTWKDGVPSVGASTATLKVTFTNINIDEGTADSEGAFGGSFIVVRHSTDYLHLMQSQGSGPLYTTTVIARETTEGRLMAVHTRHEYTDVRLPGFTSRPEMYVGDCSLGQ